MDIVELVDRLEAVLSSGSRIPLTGKAIIDEHECLDILDQLRVAVPEEVKQARRLQGERDRVLEDAEEQAERVVAHAREQANAMIQQHELVKAAEAKARLILQDADREAEERRIGADRYAAETLAQMEQQLSEQLSLVKNGIRVLSRNSYEEAESPEE